MGDGRSTCKRVQCQNKIEEHWKPWCSQDCWVVYDSMTRLPVASGGTHECTKNAVVAHSFSWLDSRHPDARPVRSKQ